MLYGLASYPKSGNTWCRTIITNLLRQSEEPADIQALTAHPVAVRDAFDAYLDVTSSDMTRDEIAGLLPHYYRQLSQEASEPLFLKLHDAFHLTARGESMLPADVTPGVVLIVRNPFDVAVSFSHFFDVTIDRAIEQMASETLTLGIDGTAIGTGLPQLVMSWSGHAKSWLDQSHIPVHLLRYEDITRDPEATVSDMARFLSLNAAPENVSRAIHFSRFEELQRQEAKRGFGRQGAGTAPFFRNGRIGEGRERLSADQIGRLCTEHGDMMLRLGYLTPDNTLLNCGF